MLLILLLSILFLVAIGYFFVGELIISWVPWPASWVKYMPPLEKEICLALRTTKVISSPYTIKIGEVELWTRNSCTYFSLYEPQKIEFSPFWKGYLWRELKLANSKKVIGDLRDKET